MERFNILLAVMASSIKDLNKAIKGLVVMSNELETMYNCFLVQQVPPLWENAAYPSLKPLASWFADLLARVDFMRNWMENGTPNSFWLSGFFFPQGFMTAVLQKYARRTKIPIDTLRLRAEVTKLDEEAAKAPEKGVMVHGLFIQGAGWDREHSRLVESTAEELFVRMPVIWLMPVTLDEPDPEGLFPCPTYKTSTRAGTLSTTGHSTNFVIDLKLPSLKDPGHWVRRGVAMLLQLDT
jgi:dynein heavy chain